VAKSDNIVPDPEREGKYAFLCPLCEFTSAGWPSKTGATQRGDQHFADHEGTPTPELAESGITGAVN
jgi:hypothetical protein